MNVMEEYKVAQRVIRVAYYIRVSTSEQVSKENSLPAQKIALDEYATANGMKCVGIYADEGKTAAKQIKKRKAIHEMLADIRDGKIDLVIFTRFDRFTRNPEEYFKMMETFNAAGVQWKAINQPELDLNTDMGQTLILFYLGMGRQEIANISERIKATAAVRVQKGSPITGAHCLPYTHTIGHNERGDKIVIPDPEQLPAFWAFVNHYELHHSKRAAMIHANEVSGANHSYDTYTRALNNTLQYGHYKGVDGYCEALVTKERFESWKKINAKNVRGRKTQRTYIFTQLCTCALCGRRMAGHYSASGKDGKEYYYYRCNEHRINKNCSNAYSAPELTVEKYLLEMIRPEIKRYIAEYELKSKEPVKKSNADKIKKLEKKLQRVNYQFEEDRISQKEYDAKYKAIVSELDTLRNEDKKEITKRDLEPLRAFMSLDLDEIYKTLSPDEKRALWRSVVSEIVVHPDKRLEVKFF